MTNILLLVATLTASMVNAATAEISASGGYYAYPIENVARLYSANFGEMRSNHFHSGVDIKSDGVIGKRVVSAADGYVSRISLSPYGYGLSIYVAHPNGTTTQYGHLSKFRDDIQKYVDNERYRLKQHSVNLFLSQNQFPVKRGDLIAFSGNSGSSSGPHLHFEIRESRAQKPLNPIAMGAIQPVDKVKPIFVELYYIESETIDGVMHPNKMSRYELVRTESGEYQIAGDKLMWVGREGHFVVAVSDRKANVTNRFGVYAIESYKDGELIYKHQQDGFLFANTRYSNSVSYFPLQRKTSTEYYRLRRQEGLPQAMISFVKDNGMIRTVAGEQHEISIVARDDMGNRSKLTFNIRGKDDKDCFKANIDPSMRIVRAKSGNTFKDEGIEVTIPSGTLYESIPYIMSRSKTAPAAKVGVAVHSHEYTILDYDTPLHKAMEVSIETDIPEERVKNALMVFVSESGYHSVIKGSYKDGRYTAVTRSAGRFYVASDATPPTITSKVSAGANLSKNSYISFVVSDNFSGMSSFEATLDGKWIALDLDGATLIHKFRSAPNGATHELIIRAKDVAGNEATHSLKFVR